LTGTKIEPKSIKQYLLTFGAVPLDISNSVRLKKSTLKGKDEDITEIFKEIYNDIINEIKKSPHINNVDYTPSDNVRIISSHFGETGQTFRLFDIVKIECNLPERLQNSIPLKKYLIPQAELDSSSSFTLLFDGSIFAFFRPMLNVNGIPCGATDSRKMLQDIFSSKFSIIQTYPTPLRIDYIIHLEPDENLDEDISFERKKDHVIIKTQQGLTDPEAFIRWLFKETHNELQDYYSMMSKNNQVRVIEASFYPLCDSLLKKRSTGLLLSSYHIFEKRKIVIEIEKIIQEFYNDYSRWSVLCSEIKKERDNIIERFNCPLEVDSKDSNTPLNIISSDLLKNVGESNVPISAHLDVVELAQNYVLQYKQNTGMWLTVGISLLSAIIGALIGVYFVK